MNERERGKIEAIRDEIDAVVARLEKLMEREEARAPKIAENRSNTSAQCLECMRTARDNLSSASGELNNALDHFEA